MKIFDEFSDETYVPDIRTINNNPKIDEDFVQKTAEVTQDQKITEIADSNNNTKQESGLNIVQRNLRGFNPYGGTTWKITDAEIAQMLLLSSISISQFEDSNKKQQMIDQVRDYGLVIDKTLVSEEHVNQLCQEHASHQDGFGRFESNLVLDSLPIDSLIHEINQECAEDKYPKALGQRNLQKLCMLFFADAECAYLQAIESSFGCTPMETKLEDQYFGVYLRLKIPWENINSKSPSEGNPKYFLVESLPTYNFFGILKSRISIPVGLILSVKDDGATKLFSQCIKSYKSMQLYVCQTEYNIPIGLNDCIISTFYGIQTSCPG